MRYTKEELEQQKKIRTNQLMYNHQGYLMYVVKYIKSDNVIIQFLDKYGATLRTIWENFKNGTIKNPYAPCVYGHGMIGNKYPSRINLDLSKEYSIWHSMLYRCYDNNFKNANPTYQDVVCCEEWLLYENFYEWLHSQENFEKWLNGNKWAVDKDILVKGNKVYSPETCCLIPHCVNSLFVKNNADRGNLPIGVTRTDKKFEARIRKTNKFGKNYTEHIGRFLTPEDAFYLGYKPAKETYIKQIAQEEYEKGNITKRCYDAMMKYEVEITD